MNYPKSLFQQSQQYDTAYSIIIVMFASYL